MNESAFKVAVIAVAVVLAGAFARLSFCGGGDLPPVPSRPAVKRVASPRVSATIEADPGVYAEHLARDSRSLRIEPTVTPADLTHVLAYQVADKRFALVPRGKGASTEVLGLKLSLSLSDIEGTPRRQMVLTIHNTTDEHLAYRVDTRPSQGTRPCHEKLDLAHNAVALAPGQKIRRSECIYKSGFRLFVNKVETMVLPVLSYYYVSALPPDALGLDRLAARGHRPIAGRPLCRVFHAASLDGEIRSGATSWRDLVDFYSRHPCQIFTFPNGYKAFTVDGQTRLPAVRALP
jgi:hypothetical protein